MDNGNGTGLLSGTPAAGTAGTYAMTFTAANGVGAAAVQSFTLTVRDVSLPAAAAAQLVMGPGPGSSPVVRVITATDDRTVQAYDAGVSRRRQRDAGRRRRRRHA